MIARAEIITHPRPTDPPKDYTSNVLYFFADGTIGDANYQNLAEAVSNLWHIDGGLTTTWGPFANRSHEVRVYSMADALPRPIRGQKTYTAQFPQTGNINPRQIALVLSYYGDRNLPRTRGRIYIGPWDTLEGNIDERPHDNHLAITIDLGHKLQAVNGSTTEGWQHCVYSKHTPTSELAVAHYWVNDVWDTQRRRSPKETKRVHYDV